MSSHVTPDDPTHHMFPPLPVPYIHSLPLPTFFLLSLPLLSRMYSVENVYLLRYTFFSSPPAGPLSTALYSGRFSQVVNTKPDMAALLLRARDVACGMEYLHARGICHGDLKCDNVLLQRDKDDPYSCAAKVGRGS